MNCILLGYYAANSDTCPQIPCRGQNPNFSALLTKYECFYGNTELHNLSSCWMHTKTWYKQKHISIVYCSLLCCINVSIASDTPNELYISPRWATFEHNLQILKKVYSTWGTAVAQWLRCCATNQKVTGSIPDGVIGIFHWHNPSNRTMALGSTQPLTETSTSISWG